jgi:hypothetical protein
LRPAPHALIQRKAPIAGEVYLFTDIGAIACFPRCRIVMSQKPRRNRLMPWYIGIAVILAAVAYIGYQMINLGCPAPLTVELLVLTVIPVVYLALMYLTFVSQE